MNGNASPLPLMGGGDGGVDLAGDARTSASPFPVDAKPALNLDWITPDLAVGGAFADDAVAALAKLGIGAVVDLRSEARDDEARLSCHGLSLLHLPTEDHHAVSQAMLEDGVAFALDHLQRGRRVLIHCREGIGRSVTLALCVMAALGHAPLAAMTQIKDRRVYASPSPAQFEAWATWMRGRGITPPAFDDFAAIAYRHLKRG